MLTVKMPSYLKGYENEYNKAPRQANIEWFKNAKYGLFLHYGLFSILGTHEWAQYNDTIPVSEYAKLMDSFTAEKFDADYIVRFAKDCGMKYINITTRHHDSFCIWDTKETPFNSMNSPAKRDLVKELADACQRHGIALFLYYSHGRDWKHPHAPNNDKWGGKARPLYDTPETSYKYGDEHDLDIYLEFMTNQIKELLTQYPTIAGIWLDGIAVPLNGDTEKFRCQELYDFIHELHPHALVSYKQGVTGTEDFFAPEHSIPKDSDDAKKAGKITSDKIIEICTTMTLAPKSAWGYRKDGIHRDAKSVVDEVIKAREMGANLLLNTGPLPDGSIDSEDEKALREACKMLKEQGIL